MKQDDQHLIEICISSEVVLDGGMMRVKRDQVLLPSGNQSQREFILHPGAVLIIPILENGNLLLERQFRYPLNRVFVELPAGKIDPGEDILFTGQRELLEETGWGEGTVVNITVEDTGSGNVMIITPVAP